MSDSVKNNIYDGCRVLHPNGKLMFLCNNKRANWYLNRNLARKIDSKPLTIQLTFTPNGNGNIGDDFYLQPRQNQCVVCGSKNNLSRHHVVPYCYVRTSSHYFRHSSHDVLPMCIECHELYEHKYSLELRQELAREFDAPISGNGKFIDKRRSAGYASTLIRHGEHIPESRQQQMLYEISQQIGHFPSQAELKEMAAIPKKIVKSDEFQTHGEIVMSLVQNIDEFVQRWREHFIKTMKPRYLPPYWDAKRPIKT